MRVERILNEHELLKQRTQSASRVKREAVLSEDAVSFEGNEQRNEQGQAQQYTAYKRKLASHVTVETETPEDEKEELDVLA